MSLLRRSPGVMAHLLAALRDSLAGLESLTLADAAVSAMATAAMPGSAPGCGELLALTDRYDVRLAMKALVHTIDARYPCMCHQ